MKICKRSHFMFDAIKVLYLMYLHQFSYMNYLVHGFYIREFV